MIKKFLQKFLTYGVGNILQTALRFILLPLYLRFFAPEDYGVISVLSVLMAMLTLFITAGIMNGLVRLYYEADGLRRKELVGVAWFWYVVVAALGGAILLTQARLWSVLFFQTPDHTDPVRLLGLLFIFTILQQVPQNIFRLENKAELYVTFSLVTFLADFVLKFYFIVILGRGVMGYFESGVIASVLTLVVMLPFTRQYVRISSDLSLFRQMFRLGFPYIFSGLAAWVLEVSDRILLARFAGESAVGIYSLAYSFSNMFGVFLATPIALLLDPFFFAYAAKHSIDETKRLLSRMLIYSCLAGGVVYLAIALGSSDLLRVLTTYLGARPAYLAAVKLVPIVTLAPFLYFLTSPASMTGLLVKKPELASTVFVIAAGVNLGLNLFVIPLLGALGAAITTLVAYLLLVIMLYVWMERVFAVGHN